MNDDEDDDDDGAAGHLLKTEGMFLAAHAQDSDDDGRWAAEALATIHAIALSQKYLDSADVRAYGLIKPRHHNAWGSVWQAAIRKKWIAETNEQPRRTSTRREAHGAKMTRYKSLIFNKEGK